MRRALLQPHPHPDPEGTLTAERSPIPGPCSAALIITAPVRQCLPPSSAASPPHPFTHSFCVLVCRCYETKDCASFIKTCPFTNDTKKGGSLASCLPDKSEFVKTACPADAKAAAKKADGKDIPLNSTVTCFKSDKLTCQVFKNGTGHSTVAAACKEAAKKASTAATPSALHACLLLGLLLVRLCCPGCSAGAHTQCLLFRCCATCS